MQSKAFCEAALLHGIDKGRRKAVRLRETTLLPQLPQHIYLAGPLDGETTSEHVENA
jgi:hypothetical protein